jgi:hypothetical protein
VWETHEGLGDVVKSRWKETPEISVAGVGRKLTELSTDLNAWSYNTFGSVRSEIRKLKRRLEELRNVPYRVGPSHEELKINERLAELFFREETMWRQRSRVEWLSSGDKNSKYFHQRASMRRRKNRIKNLMKEDGEITVNIEEMKNIATSFYQTLYASEGTTNMNEVIDVVPRKVTVAMNEHLTAPYQDAEIKNALFQMFPTKAPGPDGFPAQFFQRNWNICGADVILVVRRILNGDESAEVINKTV